MRAIMLVAALFFAGCSSANTTPAPDDAGSDGAIAATPLTQAVTSGGLHLAVRTDPQPPPRGTFNVLLDVEDANGAPQDGLTIDALPWMPAMGHGSSIRTSVTPQGHGRYAIGNVGMFMPGDWELRLTISGRLDDHAAPIIPVP